jgi:hypothetical protein
MANGTGREIPVPVWLTVTHVLDILVDGGV